MTNEGFKLQASVKDHDGDMVNFRADSPDELAREFKQFPYADYAAAKAALRGAGAASAIAKPAEPEWATQQPAQQQPAQQGGWGQQQTQQQAQPQAVAQVRLHPDGKTCGCGRTLEYKKVVRKSDNKEFEFWSCPAQQKRGDGHDSEFVN